MSSRRPVFWAGLAVIALANYVDLTGRVDLPVDSWVFSTAAMIWATFGLLLPVVASDQEVRRLLSDASRLLVAWTVGTVAVGSLHHGASTTYILNATPGGQLAYSVTPTVVFPWILLAFLHVLIWGQEYRRLRRTTPEERVLGRDP